jgi:hypothetical protein
VIIIAYNSVIHSNDTPICTQRQFAIHNMCSAHHSTSSLTLHVIHGALHDATTHVDENTQQLTVWLFHLICYFDHLYDVLFCCIYCDNVCTNNHYLLVLFVLSILCVCADCLFDYLLF